MSEHEAGLRNAFLWFSKHTQALGVRSEETEVAASLGDCWQSGGTCWCAWACPWLPQVDPEELKPSHKAGRHPKCIICLYKWALGSQGTPAVIISSLLVEGFSPVVCQVPSSAQFLAVFSSEWALKGFSHPWSFRVFKEPLRTGGRQACRADMHKDRPGFHCGSYPVLAAWPVGWGTPGAALGQVSPQFSASRPPWHGPGMAPCRKRPDLLHLCSLSNGYGQGFH